jgi:hypothetical protein
MEQRLPEQCALSTSACRFARDPLDAQVSQPLKRYLATPPHPSPPLSTHHQAGVELTQTTASFSCFYVLHLNICAAGDCTRMLNIFWEFSLYMGSKLAI